MNLEEMVKDSVETMPDRLKSAELDPDFRARIGLEIGAQVWTLEVEGGSCHTEPSSGKDCDAVVQTGCEEWVGVASNAVDPTALFLAGKLRVEGDIEKLLTTFGLFESDASDELEVKGSSCNFLPTVNRHNGASYHLLLGTRARASDEEIVDIVGPNCSGDLIQPRRKVPRMERGDLLIFLDVGAYNSVAANQFNSIPRPPCVLVSGAQADLICERETINDVFARQCIPARLMG